MAEGVITENGLPTVAAEQGPRVIPQEEKDRLSAQILAGNVRHNGRVLNAFPAYICESYHRFGTEEPDPLSVLKALEGYVRGGAGEEISDLLPPDSPLVETVYVCPGDRDHNILDGLELRPAYGKESPLGRRAGSKSALLHQNIGHGALSREETQAPDGFLVMGEQIVGAVEVKAWREEELREDLARAQSGETPKIDGQLEKETEMVRLLTSRRDKSDDNWPIILLRVPHDTSTETIKGLGRSALESGIRIVIQRLPLTADELTKLGTQMLMRGFELAIEARAKRGEEGNGTNFSNQELAVVAQLIEKHC